MENSRSNGLTITDALKLLEEAAENKREELRSVMADKYTHLRSLVGEAEISFARALHETKEHAVSAALRAKDAGVEKGRELVTDVDKSVRHNPWPYIGGTAVISLLLGYVLARNRK